MNILIVDDNTINRKLLRVLLDQEGFNTVEAVDGLEALEILKQNKIDLIISDILMPNMDGYRLCVEIRKSNEFNHIPLIFYTSTYTSPSDEKFAMEIGADKFIKKPTPIKTIVATINELTSTPKILPLLVIEEATELELLKNYNERLITKLEEKNSSLEQTKNRLLETNQQLIKRTEELQKSEKEIRDIFENIQDIFYHTDIQGTLSMISSSIERYGYKASELIGSKVGFIYANATEADLLINTLLEKHSVEDLEVKLKDKKGESFYASISARLLTNDLGNAIGIAGIFRDISQRKFAEQRLEMQYMVARLLADSDSLKSASQGTLKIICETLNCEIGSFWIIQPNATLKHIETWQSPNIKDDEVIKINEQLTFSLGVGFPGYVWANGEPIWCADLAKDIHFNFFRLATINKLGLNSAMGFPVMLGKETLGILEFFYKEIRPFNSDLLNMVTAISNQLGQFVERKRAENSREERIQLSALNADVGYALIQNNSLQEILTSCTEAIVRHLNVAFARIWTFNKAQNMLELQASAGMYTHLNGPHSRIPLGKLKIGTIAEERKPHLTNTVIGDPRVGDQEWAKSEGMVAFAGYPLIVADRLVGVIAMFAKQQLTEATLEAIKAAANEIAVGIERKRNEKELKDSERRFALFMDNLPGIAFIKDKLGQWIYINETLAKTLNLKSNDWYGKTDSQMVSSDIAEIYTENDRFVFDHKESIQAIEPLPQNDGIHEYIVSKFPILDNGETSVLLGGIGIDVTERLVAEAQLKQERELLAQRVEERTAELSFANAQLERANRLKDEFLASMSHELRTPLNAILGLSEVLQEEIYGTLTAKQRKSLSTIEESGRHLLALINDILDLSKIEAEKLELNLGSVLIDSVCQASLRIIKETVLKKQIKVFTMSDNLATTLQTDERRLKQILVNLLSNAVKFTPDGGKVGLEVLSDVEKQTVNFTVWDNGIGILEEDLSRLFQPFVQLDSSLARQHNGTGLGLALVKRMAQLLGGSISVESEIGKGSRFTVSLPWKSNSPIPFLEEEYHNVFEDVKIHHAVIIEDTPAHSEQIARYLTEMGAQASICTQGSQAINLVTQSQPDIVFLDILLPDLSGVEVLKQLKANPSTQNIPVVVVSIVDERKNILELGAVDLLVKPVSRLQVLKAIKKALLGNKTNIIATPKIENQPAPKLILLAEDNSANIETLCPYLISKGYQIVVAYNGVEAVESAKKRQPDLILMDIQMPGMDGLEATRLIRADAKLAHIPIIAITALAMAGDRERCIEAGANSYISKPLKLKELINLIEGFFIPSN